MKTHMRPRTDGFGYAWTPYRVEHRPTYGPYTKDELLRTLDMLAACGVKAWWTSVSAKGSYPLFRSRHLPCRSDAVEYFPWLVEEGHRRGIAMFSWEYLTTAPLLADRHDEWGWRCFGDPDPSDPRARHFFCHNSPYGELMARYSVEVVRDLGFDGIWFDGSFLFQGSRYACRCAFCEAKHLAETGRELPRRVDLNDPDFRRFLEWRQADYMAHWRRIAARVREAKPSAVIVFNHFNRLIHNTESGAPLQRLAGDAPAGPSGETPPPMEAMIATELGVFQQQAGLMVKTLRAINDNYPPEVWVGGTDAPGAGKANVNPVPLLYHARMCAAAGGFASFGFGGEPAGFKGVLEVLTRELAPLAPYVGGEQVPCVGVVLSGATKDYAYPSADGSGSFAGTAWKSVFGTESILGGLHIPSDILLDNMLADGFLSRCQAVVLPETQCVSDEAAAALTRYVEGGGTLLAAGDAATRTMLGEPRERGALDDLFGVSWRADASVQTTMELADPSLRGPFRHDALPDDRLYAGGLPSPYAFPGLGRPVRSEAARVLAASVYRPPAGRRWGPDGLLPPEAGGDVPCAAILLRERGRGRAFCVVPNLACEDAQWGPFPPVRELYARLLLPHLTPPFTTDAPPDVLVTLWRQENRRVFHLLRLPATCRVLPWFDFYRCPPGVLVAERLPVPPVRIALPDEGEDARMVGGPVPKVRRGKGLMRIEVPAFDTHAAVVLE